MSRVRRWSLPMTSRNPAQAHRASTPLELLVDLCSVVAIAQVAIGLHHGILEGHTGAALQGYAIAFFAIWWAWINFTWFASAYDTDDIAYRLTTLIQIVGALVIAAGVPQAFARGDLTLITYGYVVMRIGLVTQWLRVAVDDRARRRTALRYAIGITLLQTGWLVLLIVPASMRLFGAVGLIALEVVVPVWAERAGATTWHRVHIAERYGLLNLIVIGECISSATGAIRLAMGTAGATWELVSIVAGGLLVVFALWWIYFDHEAHDVLDRKRVFVWGYGHYFVFSAMAALGAGIAVAADHAVGRGSVSSTGAAAAVGIPMAVYILSVWWLHIRPHRRRGWPYVAASCAALLAIVTPQPLLVMGLTGVALVGWLEIDKRQALNDNQHEETNNQ